MTKKAQLSGLVGLTDFAGKVASCAQQHLILGRAGTFLESHGWLGVVRWQHSAFGGIDPARSWRWKTPHDPGGRAKTRLVTTATNWWRNVVIAVDYTQHDSEACGQMKEFRYPIAFAMTKAAVAANPPTMTVCHALRKGRAVVNRPLM
jgi:hypothetical protein